MPQLNDILTANYTHADAAFALQHGQLSVFLKNMNRKGVRYYPRKISAGPGGGIFRYGHILEIALHLAIGLYRPAHIARAVVGGLDKLLTGNEFALSKISALPNAERNAIIDREIGYVPADYPSDPNTGHLTVSRYNTMLLDHPEFVLTEDFISRDPKTPTFLIYNPTATEGKSATDVALIANMTLSDAHNAIIDFRSQNSAADNRQYIEEDSDDLTVLNLTSLMTRLERRLALRLEGNQITDFRR